MVKIFKVIALLLLLIGLNAITVTILQRNLDAGVYPMYADSIGIPIMATALFSMEVAAALCAALLLTNRWVLRWCENGRGIRNVIVALLLTLLHAFALLSALLGALHWWSPHHEEIVIAHLSTALVVLVFSIADQVQLARMRRNVD